MTLAIARALAARLNAEPGMRAVLTRDRDEFLELRDRIRRARLAHADLFVSVHADSIADRSVSGASVYVLSDARRVQRGGALAGRARERGGPDGRRAARRQGRALAPVLLDAVADRRSRRQRRRRRARASARSTGVGEVRKAQVQQAGFVVLKSPDIPSMLVETAYISNPAEERRLRQPAQQARLARRDRRRRAQLLRTAIRPTARASSRSAAAPWRAPPGPPPAPRR